jgi:hypothetical protein
MFGQIRPLTSDDLPGCLALTRDREWLAALGRCYGSARDLSGGKGTGHIWGGN